MSQETWSAVDDYLTATLVKPDAVLEATLRDSEAAGLPPISVSAPQGKLLHLLARVQGARNILEIGTLGGYSAIWLARALEPGGRLVTLEYDAKHADVARVNIARAGLAGSVDVRVGRALDTLPKIAAEGLGPFDLVFIDADKPSNPDYFQWALRLSRRGTIIIVDNVVRDGAVLDEKSADPTIVGTRRVLELMAGDPRVSATAIQTVGVKGWDGLAIAVVTAES
jgi:predicted O-methyltransferase YrrM